MIAGLKDFTPNYNRVCRVCERINCLGHCNLCGKAHSPHVHPCAALEPGWGLEPPREPAPAPAPAQEPPHPATAPGGWRPNVDAWEAARKAENDGATDAEIEMAYRVAENLISLRAKETAHRAFVRENTPPAPPFDAGSLREILTRPEEPPYRVDRLIPAGASTLVTAMRKTGKTTMMLNLADSLITGREFLGEFTTQPAAGNVAFLNYEVSGATLARWAAEHGIDPDRLQVVNLRGRRNPLTHDEDRAALAAWLKARDVESLIVDPFGRAYGGASQNDAGEVGAWLVRLDEFARVDVGAKDLILTAHAGWSGDRTRGTSALEDWPDSIITLTRDTDDDDEGGQRFFRAIGRDVEVEEDMLRFDPTTRRLTLSGTGSRQAGKRARQMSKLKTDVLLFVKEHPGCSGEDIRTGVEGDNKLKTDARRALIADGVMVEEKRTGRGGGCAYTVLTLGNPS